jgi:hypothetical protein
MRLVGILLLLGALAVATIGALWTIFAAMGGEWDICRGNDCTSGEILGLSVFAAGALVGWFAVRLIRSK